jgi:hypothetical protein
MRASYPEDKATGREVDHSPTSSADIKNGRKYTFTAHSLHGVYTDNFIFFTFHEN